MIKEKNSGKRGNFTSSDTDNTEGFYQRYGAILCNSSCQFEESEDDTSLSGNTATQGQTDSTFDLS